MGWFDWLLPSDALNTLFEPHWFATDQLVLTKRSGLLAVFRHPGIEFECKTDEELAEVSHGFHTVVRNLNRSFRIYRYCLKTKGVARPYHRAEELYSFDFYLALLHEDKPNTGTSLVVREHELAERIADVEDQIGSFVSSIANLLPLERLGHAEIFQFLTKLTRSDGELGYSDHLDYWTARTPILVNPKSLDVAGTLRTMTLRQLPRQTEPNLFSALLKLPCSLILCDEFARIPNDQAIAMADASEDHFFWRKKNGRNARSAVRDARKPKDQNAEKVEDSVAAENLTEVGEIKKRIANHGEFLGQYSLTLVLSGDNLGRAVAEASNLVGNTEGELAPDGVGSLDAYLSIIPGNTNRTHRTQWILSTNYADLAPIYGPARGDPINRHLHREALCTLETSLASAYDFNLHEDDLLGALITGKMGSGKSFLTNKLIFDSQKYRPFTFILDIGHSYRYATHHFGGAYIELAKRNLQFTMNPFDCEKTDDALEYLASFVHILLSASGYSATPEESCEIDRAVRTADRLSNLEVSEGLRLKLYNWLGTGRYGRLFDNPRDTLRLHEFQTFEFQNVSKKLLEPLSFYVFQKIFSVAFDPHNAGRPKQLICDENWKFVKVPRAREYVIEAGKTGRKHNLGMVLTTQSMLDLAKVGLLDYINEICPTKILLANPGAKKRRYQKVFELNERELELFSHLTPKKQLLVKTPTRSMVLSYYPTPEEIALFSNDTDTNAKRAAMIQEYGYEEGLRKLAEEVAA